ncbi:MAG TPA: FAD-dependent oxidoreductase [Gemmatimonadaceae bacterium]|nr:FAD-dependent oxidoreductase [Gemmatimonadaceae bacterium]
MLKYDYLIIGGGMTADAASHGIRDRDKTGTIGIITADNHAPYNRPPLSKALWKGDSPDTIWRPVNETGATLHLGRHARALDTDAKQVMDDVGESYNYGKLLLATGGTPRKLPGSPDDVIYYRTFDDYQRTRKLADGGARFIVVGGGFIGAEVAAGIRMQGRDVTMIIPEAGICARVFPRDLAAFVAQYYRDKGVTVSTEDGVTNIAERGAGFRVQTKKSGDVDADAVVAGLGITPDVDLAKTAGIATENGIIVDEQLRTNKADVYAAGDVANFMNAALGARTRVEHEDNANTMGAMAGRNMAGASERYDHLPFFYSDLFELGYEAVGDVDARHQTVADWKTEFREGVVYYLDAGRVRGVLLWNVWGKVDDARALIAERGPIDPARLKGRIA